MNQQLNKIQRELRLLKGYSLLITAMLCALWFAGFTGSSSKQRFEEIDVERINIIEKDGRLRFVLTNTDRDPGSIRKGKSSPRASGQKSPAIIFYNDDQDESGAILSVGKRNEKGEYYATSRFVFDQFERGELIELQYIDENGRLYTGLTISEKPQTLMTEELIAQVREMWQMPDGPKKWETLSKLRALGIFDAQRIFLGRTRSKSALLDLADRNGNTRLRLVVDSLGTPGLDFLDEKGNVTFRLPDSLQARPK